MNDTDTISPKKELASFNENQFASSQDVYEQTCQDTRNSNQESIDRELNAIHSEHSKNIQNDMRRTLSILVELADKKHH